MLFKQIKQPVFIMVLCFSLIGCGRGFLDLEPKSEANAVNFYQTEDDFRSALVGAYRSFRAYPGMYFELSSFRSDESRLLAPTAGTQDRYDIDQFRDNPSNQLLLGVWRDLYRGIFICNEIIEQLEGSSISKDLNVQFQAEAKFIRAYHYYNLVNFWGSVPLVLKTLTPAESLKAGQASIEVIRQAIESDLLYAADENNLPLTFAAADQGRATSMAAKALLAKLYLTEHAFDKVVTTLETLVDQNGPYTLLETPRQVFAADNKGNSEVIFAVKYNKDFAGEGHGLWLSSASSSASQIPPNLFDAYATNDRRRELLSYVRSGTSGSNYVPLKFMDTFSTINSTQVGNDFILLRFADILLMFAEASNEQAYLANGKAFSALNRIRSRADVDEYSSSDLGNQTQFRDAVYRERRLELAYEGHRWFDLVRTQTAEPVLRDAEDIDIPDFRLVFPIPVSEIEKINDPAVLRQHSGY